MGLPSLAIVVAANQQEVAHEAARQELLSLAGCGSTSSDLAAHLRTLLDDAALRERLSRNGMNAVDGCGAERVARVMCG